MDASPAKHPPHGDGCEKAEKAERSAAAAEAIANGLAALGSNAGMLCPAGRGGPKAVIKRQRAIAARARTQASSARVAAVRRVAPTSRRTRRTPARARPRRTAQRRAAGTRSGQDPGSDGDEPPAAPSARLTAAAPDPPVAPGPPRLPVPPLAALRGPTPRFSAPWRRVDATVAARFAALAQADRPAPVEAPVQATLWEAAA